MANRTDAILLLASSSFLALGIATWYELANDKPFDFVSIFGKTGAHAASEERSLTKFQANSRANEAEFPASSDKVPANHTDPDSMPTPVEIATAEPLMSTLKVMRLESNQ